MKKAIKCFLPIEVVIALFLAHESSAQTVHYVTLSATNYESASFSIQTNQIVSVVGYDWGNHPMITGNLTDGTTLYLTPYSQNGNSPVLSSQIPQIVTGLTNITVKSGYGATPQWATFQIGMPASVSVISNYVPADAVVIPTSATGNVQIILESSMDLVNWTAANPGTYGASSATNRFFRVRAVHN